MLTQVQADAFTVKYDRTRTQYIVTRGEIAVVPTASFADPLAFQKAHGLARALNRVYAAESERFEFGADEHHFADGSPRPDAAEWFEEQRADAVRKLRRGRVNVLTPEGER